jgi:hypothetical protein
VKNQGFHLGGGGGLGCSARREGGHRWRVVVDVVVDVGVDFVIQVAGHK